MEAMNFNTICLKHGADKGVKNRLGNDGHCYAEIYEQHFSGIRDKPGLRILELGVWRGESMRVWLEYFPSSEIVGVDINFKSKNLDDIRAEPRITLIEADSRNVAVEGTFDIIVDDGDHTPGVQLDTYKHLRNKLRDGGTYWIEEFARSAWIPFKNEDKSPDFLTSTLSLMRNSRTIFDLRHRFAKQNDSVLVLMN